MSRSTHSIFDLQFSAAIDSINSAIWSGPFLVETHSFKYDVRRKGDGVQVVIRCYRWKVFYISLLWSMFWGLSAAKAYESEWTKSYFVFLSIPFCALLAVLGLFNVVRSVLSHTLILSLPSELHIRASFFGLSTTRLINVSDVESFGPGHFSHSLIPVLRLELRARSGRNEWIVFARGTSEREVNVFLQDIAAQGFLLPRSD